jgi:FKBP-type peptidyl-prolyl cis-trans isomerase FklB
MTRRSRKMLSLTNVFRNKGAIGTVIIILGIFVVTLNALAQEKGAPKDKKEKTGYAIGVNIGKDMKRLSIEIDADMVAQGVKDANAGKTKLSDEEMRATLADLSKEMQGKENERTKILGEKNKKEGEEFLSKNAKASGIVKLPSGLQYKILKEGTGKIPKVTDTVVVHYKGTFLDGTEFDSSYKRNQPAELKATGVIPGWTEILQKMTTGSKYTVFIPANLAYGEKGNGPVGPNAVIVFDIELLAIK